MTSFLLNDDLTADHHLAIAFVAEESGGCEFNCDSLCIWRSATCHDLYTYIKDCKGVEKDPLSPQAIEVRWQ